MVGRRGTGIDIASSAEDELSIRPSQEDWLSIRPSQADQRKVHALIKMRLRHQRTLQLDSTSIFRRKVTPASGMPHLVPACTKYKGMEWLPPELMVPDVLPRDTRLPAKYVLPYYGLGKAVWKTYQREPIQAHVPWSPYFDWNSAFPENDDGWAFPTSDETFARLRLQGPNPWMLQRVDDVVDDSGTPRPTFELDFAGLFEGITPPVLARFAVDNGAFVATEIVIDGEVTRSGDDGWERAKRIVNGLDIRSVTFVQHLLGTHFIVGQAFALSTYSLPSWHPLRPLLQFFTYGTLKVSHYAYDALLAPVSYFVMSGFITPVDARQLLQNAIDSFDLDQWIVPRDIEDRGIDAIPDHPYVEDATMVWPSFVEFVQQYLDELGLNDEAVAADLDLQAWCSTLSRVLPNTDLSGPLTRARLEELLVVLVYNNVVHEICGDLSPILGSREPADKAIVNLANLKAAMEQDGPATAIAHPSMADVFLMDQASFVSRFNVAGNNLLTINADALIDDPKLRDAVKRLQLGLKEIEINLKARNQDRAVNFARMLPSNWEASISF